MERRALHFRKVSYTSPCQTHNADDNTHTTQGELTMNAATLEGFRMIADQMLGTPVVTAEQLDEKIKRNFAELDAKLAKLKAMMAEG